MSIQHRICLLFDLQENYRMGGSYEWPTFDEVLEYKKNVREIILKLIDDMPLDLPITMDSPWVSPRISWMKLRHVSCHRN